MDDDLDDDLKPIQIGIDAERERRQRAREAREERERLQQAREVRDGVLDEWRRQRDERETIANSAGFPFRAEPGASGVLTFHVDGQEVRRVSIGEAARAAPALHVRVFTETERDILMRYHRGGPISRSELAVVDNIFTPEQAREFRRTPEPDIRVMPSPADLRAWADFVMPDELAPFYDPDLSRPAGRAAYARLARHFYRQRDAALKRVRELEAALEEAHKRMIRFRMRPDGGEA